MIFFPAIPPRFYSRSKQDSTFATGAVSPRLVYGSYFFLISLRFEILEVAVDNSAFSLSKGRIILGEH
jgi:hypothetical protein